MTVNQLIFFIEYTSIRDQPYSYLSKCQRGRKTKA